MIDSVLTYFPPMGVYETLFKFLDATGKYMGTEGTHPWAQGFPLTTPLPDGPDIPTRIEFTHADLKYPQATGGIELLTAVRDYYNDFYGARITTDNVAIFAGGRPGIYATLAFLHPGMRVLIEETEYTPYWDALKLLGREHVLIPSHPGNRFRPTLDDYRAAGDGFVVKSNPCNPTGVTWTGDQLKGLVEWCSEPGRGGLIDEAYEFFHEPEPESAMRHIPNIDDTNLFVVSAATKGLQAPGLRVGWVVASKANIEIFRNFSSIAMGGVARPSQIAVAGLLEPTRVARARRAVGAFFGSQRRRYEIALRELGFELYTGEGGFYHWGRLPGGLSAEAFNERLFRHEAAILPGTLCDMLRRGPASPLANFMRFSFGPLKAESYESDVAILRACASC
ncbi:MAG TPA: pyridoxal phosphate-dependent aminotransferase [Fimbriimonadaceae bacterium]|nr:pyridoxal phosphate-dependent aminotransferase [Fimbriimonadaceae bacterium]